jgi:predicted transcriptional regulator
MQVKDIMSRNVVTVYAQMDVRSLAKLLMEKNVSGAPVVDENGRYCGVVLEESLVFQDKNVHLPTFLALSVGFLPWGTDRMEDEIRRIAGTRVAEIMEENASVVQPEMEVEDLATQMVEKNRHFFAVMEKDAIVGVVTKRDIVRAIAEGRIH